MRHLRCILVGSTDEGEQELDADLNLRTGLVETFAVTDISGFKSMLILVPSRLGSVEIEVAPDAETGLPMVALDRLHDINPARPRMSM